MTAFTVCVGCPPDSDCVDLGEGCGAHWDSWRALARLEHMRGLAAGVDCHNPDTHEPLTHQPAHLPRLKAAGLTEAEL